jgi:hypothetical protein
MSRGRQKIWFEGVMKENLLEIFTVIRGFADLRDLAEVSNFMPYQGAKNGENQKRGTSEEDEIQRIRKTGTEEINI